MNEDDPGLKALQLVEELLRGVGTGNAVLCTDNMQFGKVLTADVLPILQSQHDVQHLVCAFTDFCCPSECVTSECIAHTPT